MRRLLCLELGTNGEWVPGIPIQCLLLIAGAIPAYGLLLEKEK